MATVSTEVAMTPRPDGDRVQIAHAQRRMGNFAALASFVLVVAVLRIAEAVLIPLALAALLTFLLSPVVVALSKRHVPKTVAIILTVTLAFAVLGTLGWVLTTQAINLAERLPDYEENLQKKISAVKKPREPGALTRTTEMLEKLRRELRAPDPQQPASAPAASPQAPAPIPVEIHPPAPTAWEMIHQIAAPALGPLGVAGIVIVLVVAMLFQRDDLRDRFIKVISAGQLNLATQAVDDAARRVTRYLTMQLVVNATYGIPVGIGLWLIGIPNAVLWGVLATLLRFIPFLGPWIAATFPVVLSIAVDPGWSMLLYTVLLFAVMELISNNIIEIWLYGASTGISNLALLVAAVFWTWLWGTPGLFLSTPLTVCLLVLGKYVPGMRFMSVLLGSEPVLSPPSQFYRRMLSMNPEEMLDLANKFIEERSTTAFYDEVFIPALIMSEEDRHNGDLTEARQQFIIQASRDLIEELDRRSDPAEAPATDKASLEAAGKLPPKSALQFGPARPQLLIVPARDEADELVALMLQHLLREQGIVADVSSVRSVANDTAARVDEEKFEVAFVSALPPAALTAARQMCRRLQQRSPHAWLMVGVWTREVTVDELKARFRQRGPDALVATLAEAVAAVDKKLNGAEVALTRDEAAQTPPVTSDGTPISPAPDVEPEELYETITRELAKEFEVPLSLVTLLDRDPPFWKTQRGVPEEMQQNEHIEPPDFTLRNQAQNGGGLLIIEDVSKDRRFANHPILVERGIRFFAGALLHSSNGTVVGLLSVIDTKPRTITEVQQKLLSHRAAELMAKIDPATPPDSHSTGTAAKSEGADREANP